MKDKYIDYKPIPNEKKYYEWDDEFCCWGVFGEDSGFCFGQFGTEEKAREYIEKEHE